MNVEQCSNENLNNFNQELFSFLSSSPTPYHAVEWASSHLIKKGFKELEESQEWPEKLNGKYFIKREGSLIAFITSPDKLAQNHGWRILGAHTDSPSLKVRPHADIQTQGYFQLGVEVYGGPLLAPWFDRDLSLAGKIYYQTTDGQLKSVLWDVKKPLAIIPNLAIHLNREANEKRSINKQTELSPLLCMSPNREKKNFSFHDWLKEDLTQKGVASIQTIMGHDLRFYDTQKPQLIGPFDDFISSARLDNLLSCFIALKSLAESHSSFPQVVALFDHEEVGSESETGAQGPLLRRLLQRVTGSTDSYAQSMARSLLISIDNAHSVHPNYLEAHEPYHRPVMNGGPVIKINANQRYATSGATESYFQWLCEKSEIPCQKITVRGDKPCGSTIGPITTHNLGLPAVDIGLPTLAMHSIRELAGSQDAPLLLKALQLFLTEPTVGPLP